MRRRVWIGVFPDPYNHFNYHIYRGLTLNNKRTFPSIIVHNKRVGILCLAAILLPW